jgi:hypothetical protein
MTQREAALMDAKRSGYRLNAGAPGDERKKPCQDEPSYGVTTFPFSCARFVVLFLAKLHDANRLEGSLTVYQPSIEPFVGGVVLENST